MKKGWMIRAGQNGRLVEDFEKGYIAIGWSKLGDLSKYNEREKLNHFYEQCFSDQKPSKRHNAAAMVNKFRNIIEKGDVAVTYDPQLRQYLVGEITGDYSYCPDIVGDYPHIREVRWLGKVKRDSLKAKVRNSLGSVLTLFSLKPNVIEDLFEVLEGKVNVVEVDLAEDMDDAEDEAGREDAVIRSRELIKDKIILLDFEEIEQLVASLLRGMGFRARVSPKGPDRGVDVIASPDGLGLQEPRIKVEVKHRDGSMGAQVIRSFIGVLRPGDRGVFVSTGGFTREARYEAERANVPLTLVDITDLADLITDYYEDFDLEGKALLPLVRIYWPAE